MEKQRWREAGRGGWGQGGSEREREMGTEGETESEIRQSQR